MRVILLLLCVCAVATFMPGVTRRQGKGGVKMLFGGLKGGGGAGKGDSCLPDVGKFNRPRKPLILFEYEASAPSKVVRQACQLLDLIVEHRPCPGGRYGFSDNLQTKSQGSRTTPYLITSGFPAATPSISRVERYEWRLNTA